MAKHIETFKGWAETFRTDVAALKALVEEKGADMEARKLAVGALSYLVTRMDLVPDWNEGIGMMDDIMVVKILATMKPDVVAPIFEEMSKTTGPDGPLAKRAATLSDRLRLLKSLKTASTP